MLLGVIGMMTACNDEPEYFVLPEQPDEMKASVQFSGKDDVENNAIVLDVNDENAEALHLTWTPIKSEFPVVYKVRFLDANNSTNISKFYASNDSKAVGTFITNDNNEVVGYSISNNKLNTIISPWSDLEAEFGASLTIQVVGTVLVDDNSHYLKPQVSTVSVNTKGCWEVYPNTIWAHITDADGKTTTQELTQKVLGSGVYNGPVAAVGGTVYFTKKKDVSYPAYYCTTVDGEPKINYVTEEGEYEEFAIESAGTMIVDIRDEFLDVRVLDIKIAPSDRPYVVGDAVDIGWDVTNEMGYMKLSEDPRTPYIYTYEGNFYAPGEFPGNSGSEGKFKIALSGSFDTNVLFAPEADADPTEGILKEPRNQNNGGDNKWQVRESGIYVLTIDVLNMTITLVPVE